MIVGGTANPGKQVEIFKVDEGIQYLVTVSGMTQSGEHSRRATETIRNRLLLQARLRWIFTEVL